MLQQCSFKKGFQTNYKKGGSMEQRLYIFQNFIKNLPSQNGVLCQPFSDNCTAVLKPVASASPVGARKKHIVTSNKTFFLLGNRHTVINIA